MIDAVDINKLVTRVLFGTYNIIHGGRLKALYKEVREQNELNQVFDMARVKKYLEKWGIQRNIKELPIMTKEDIRSHTNNLPKADISSFAYTGGSTGEPLKIPYSKKRELIRTASIAYYNQIAGYEIGDRFLIIRAKEKSKLMQLLRNELLFIPHDISKAKIENLAQKIVEKNVSVIIGYPTVIYDIATVVVENQQLRNNLNVKAIITVSEAIDNSKRLFIKRVFKSNLIDRYSNEEAGVIAQQRQFNGNYIVDKFGVFVEVLDPNTGEPVRENEVGKVVVTDTNNDLIPIIRYDTGDYAKVSEYRKGQLYSIKELVGRVSEKIFTTNGSVVSPLSLGPVIHQPFSEAGITCQFQFAQVGEKEYEFRLNGKQKKDMLEITNMIKGNLKKILGKDANIEIKYMSALKSLPSGKRPLYKNEMSD